MLGGLYLHVEETGGTRGQTVWGIPELQTTWGMRGTKELEDRHLYYKISGLGIWGSGTILAWWSSLNPCVQGRSKGGLWLFLFAPCSKAGPLLEAMPAGAGGCSLPKEPLAAALSSGQRQLCQFKLCGGFLCYWEQTAGTLVGKGRGVHRMLNRGNNITFTSALQQVALATAVSFEGPCLSTAARWLQNRTLFQTDSDAVANPQAKRIC